MNKMVISPESQQHIELVAGEALTQFETIAKAATNKLGATIAQGAEALASINTMTSSSAVNQLNRINKENRESYQVLVNEPAIARIVVLDEFDDKHVYYICRTTPISGFSNLASYRAPIGRLASLNVGSEFTLPNGAIVEVLERAQLRPEKSQNDWDSYKTIIESEDFGPLTIESLRKLLTGVAGDEVTEDILEQLLAEDTIKANIIEGVRRNVITKMGLRDQPVLDKYQDEIFRLPLDTRLLILGPPGTGKTTTLIRRLGQKLDIAYLDDSEQHLVQTVSEVEGISHASSWLMFTPTELLKQYLKEAFAQEEVAASDHHIQTWQDYRRELARNAFGVLKTSLGNGGYIIKDELASLSASSLERPIEWFEDFDAWQRKTFILELRDTVNLLIKSKSAEIRRLAEQMQKLLGEVNERDLEYAFEKLAIEAPKVQKLVTALKNESDKKIKSAITLQLNRNRGFLDDLAQFIDGLPQAQTTNIDEQDDLDGDEEDDTTRTGRAAALNAYTQAVRMQTRAAALNRSVNKTSRNGKILYWLQDRGISEADRESVGESLIIQSHARRFLNPLKRYLDSIPKNYRAFRRERQKDGLWYHNEGFEVRDIHPLELDIILLAILRTANELIGKSRILRNIDSPVWSALKPILSYYRNQILVDEATDFSPIQLACMVSLTHPRLRSFFACGDFNQRLTTWGTRSAEELKWVCADFNIKEMIVSYRQSKQLNDLAHAIIRTVGGAMQDVNLPFHIDSNGVLPTLLEHADNLSKVVNWLTDRIREIELFVGQLPSIAIFVKTETDVEPLAKALNSSLAELNIPVVACREGQTVSQDSNIRVFDIKHIKGLEFEAVFFIDVDKLALLHPTLFDKYLYVGTTRAATYLGVTCRDSLPHDIESLRSHFGTDWNSGK